MKKALILAVITFITLSSPVQAGNHYMRRHFVADLNSKANQKIQECMDRADKFSQTLPADFSPTFKQKLEKNKSLLNSLPKDIQTEDTSSTREKIENIKNICNDVKATAIISKSEILNKINQKRIEKYQEILKDLNAEEQLNKKNLDLSNLENKLNNFKKTKKDLENTINSYLNANTSLKDSTDLLDRTKQLNTELKDFRKDFIDIYNQIKN